MTEHRKQYVAPDVETLTIGYSDVVCTSPGTEQVVEEGGENGFDW